MSHPAFSDCTGRRDVALASMQAMAGGTHDDLVRLVHPQAVNREARTEPPEASVPGPDGFWATALWLRTAFSELAFDVHSAVTEGDLVVVHNTMSGCHTGPLTMWDDGELQTVMPPTGRRFATTQSHWMRMLDGQVREHWANRDDLGTAQQLGWMPPHPSFLIRSALATRRTRKALRRRRDGIAA